MLLLQSLQKYTGNSLPAAITSTGNSMFVEFNTDGSTVDQGWKAVYTITSSLSCVGTTNLTAPKLEHFQMEVAQQSMIII